MSDPAFWHMNDSNPFFLNRGNTIRDVAGGVQMAPAGWSNPAPYGANCADGYLAASAPAAVPTLSEWAMILLGTMLAGFASLALMRRRQIG